MFLFVRGSIENILIILLYFSVIVRRTYIARPTASSFKLDVRYDPASYTVIALRYVRRSASVTESKYILYKHSANSRSSWMTITALFLRPHVCLHAISLITDSSRAQW